MHRGHLSGAVVMEYRQKLMACGAVLGAWLLVPGAAPAQSMSDAEKIQKLERQTELLQKQLQEQSELMRRQSELMQRQLKEVKDELARARGKPEKVEASSQKVEAKATPAASAARPPVQSAKSPVLKAPSLPEEKVKVTLGGFVSADTCGANTTWSTTLERSISRPHSRSHHSMASMNFMRPLGRADSRCSSRATSTHGRRSKAISRPIS
jgi:hypothetical protein